jgi:hypothetical protein
MDDLFASPPFRPAEALLQLKGMRVIELRSDETFITVRLARRQARTPEWDSVVLKNSADVRKCVDEVKKRLARWTEE